MFYDIFVTATAIALTLFVWYTIGFALSCAGVVKWLSQITITNPPAWVRVTIFVVLTFTAVPACALYIIVVNALDSHNIDVR